MQNSEKNVVILKEGQRTNQGTSERKIKRFNDNTSFKMNNKAFPCL